MATSVTFNVGSPAQSFTLPLAVIDKDTFLFSYMSFDGKKILEDQAYVLLNEDVNLFSEFHSFLLGGDFNWNKEICEYFAYMGYINNLNYPLDFWKIKLQDNWIRNNFYRMELWRPIEASYWDIQAGKKVEIPGEEVRSLLLIEPGPYVGLVDLTPTFHNQVIARPHNTIKDLEVLKEVVDFSTGQLVLAGGAPFTLLYGDDRMPADLDLFITTKDENLC